MQRRTASQFEGTDSAASRVIGCLAGTTRSPGRLIEARAAWGPTASPGRSCWCGIRTAACSSIAQRPAAAFFQLQPHLRRHAGLPSSSLTSLVYTPLVASSGRKANHQAANAAMSRLTGLCSLQLLYEGADAWVPGLSALTQLTQLRLDMLDDMKQLQHLPAQLLELYVPLETMYGIPTRGRAAHKQLDLGHLTALTLLNTEQGQGDWFDDRVLDAGEHLTLQANDVLPLALKRLEVGDFAAAKPLLGLKDLEHLDLRNTVTPAEQLRQLTSLTALTEVQLTYYDMPEAQDAAAAWVALPIRSLYLGGYGHSWDAEPITLDTLQQIGTLGSSLTSLSFCTLDPFEVTPQQLAGVLQQLTCLQDLVLNDVRMYGPGSEALTAVITAAVATLPQLGSFSMSYLWRVDIAAAQKLALATQLTSLTLSKVGLDDAGLKVLTSPDSLTGLRQLDVQSSRGVTDKALPFIVQQLTQLTSLKVCDTGITAEGKQQWLAQAPLLEAQALGGCVCVQQSHSDDESSGDEPGSEEESGGEEEGSDSPGSE